MANLITIFNQITSTELSPFELFKNIVDDHYFKFRHFYFLIDGIDLKRIDRIDFNSTETTAMFQVFIKDDKYGNKLKDKINNSHLNDEIIFFSTIATLENNVLYVEIRMRPPYKNEEEIIHAG